MKDNKVPVLFLIFKRKEQSLQSFLPIKNYRPSRLYIAADGPRDNVKGEKEDCDGTRKAILNLIDWNCEVKTLFREKNLGCTNAVYRGISWFFEHEEYGIINEDDVVLSPDFFRLCEFLLPKYQAEEKIMLISSRNHSGIYTESNEYVFAYYANIWGWATWKRAWICNNNTFSDWEKYPKWKLIKRYGLFQGLMTIYYYAKCSNPKCKFGSWDYTWSFVINKLDGICICPKVNLSYNVGMVVGGANYQEGDEDPYANLKMGKINWPIIINSKIMVDPQQLSYDRKDFRRIRMIGLKKIIKKWGAKI